MPSLTCRSNTFGIAANSSWQLWIKLSTVDKSRYIPIHTLAQQLCEYICNTKAAALKHNYYLLASFGQNRSPALLVLKQAAKYICSVIYPQENCDTFDVLWYILYKKKN